MVVAVLTSTRRDLSQTPTATDGLQSTFSHELVHAFLNARLGSGIIESGFPSWFHEGMAIHFSGSGRGHVTLDPSTGGFTRTEPTAQYERYQSRYVAVLTSTRRDLSQTPTATDGLQSTFSHELVHAFLNARLGSGIIESGFPSWFHEGMAIHFSGSGRGHVTLDPSTGGFTRTEPTAQYERYQRTFLYLESSLGHSGFNQALHLAVENADPSLLIAAADESSYDELVATAELWWRWWPLPVALVRGWALWWLAGLIVMSIGAGWSLWRRWQPAVPRSALEVELNSDLLAAIQSGDAGTVRYLIRSGAHANAQDGDGRSALMWAVWMDQFQAVEALVNAGAKATREIRGVAELRGCSPDIVRVLADGVARDGEEWSDD